jgi:hypothetical protein
MFDMFAVNLIDEHEPFHQTYPYLSEKKKKEIPTYSWNLPVLRVSHSRKQPADFE